MNYTLTKTRVNTDITQLRRIFRSADSLKKALSKQIGIKDCDFDFLNYSYGELNLMSALAEFKIKTSENLVPIQIRFMQSTRKTELCFDVFVLIVNTEDQGIIEAEVKKTASDFLESLRVRYNGDWHISDKDLSDKALR